MEVIIIVVIYFVVFGLIGSYIAKSKGRNGDEGGCLGIMLGPIGLLIAVLMPTKTLGQAEPQRPVPPETLAERQNREAEEAARDVMYAKIQVRHAERLREAEEVARAHREAFWEGISAFLRPVGGWFVRVVLKCGWYRDLPEFAQPIALGLLFAVPVVVILILLLR